MPGALCHTCPLGGASNKYRRHFRKCRIRVGYGPAPEPTEKRSHIPVGSSNTATWKEATIDKRIGKMYFIQLTKWVIKRHLNQTNKKIYSRPRLTQERTHDDDLRYVQRIYASTSTTESIKKTNSNRYHGNRPQKTERCRPRDIKFQRGDVVEKLNILSAFYQMDRLIAICYDLRPGPKMLFQGDAPEGSDTFQWPVIERDRVGGLRFIIWDKVKVQRCHYSDALEESDLWTAWQLFPLDDD